MQSHSSIHALYCASDGIRQSPRGDNATEPTVGPSGIAERLNCCEKKREKKVFIHRRIVARS